MIENRRNLLKFIFFTSIFFYTKSIAKTFNDQTNTRILSSSIFKKFKINKDHPERPERIEYIKKAISNSSLINIFEQYDTQRNVEYWTKLIHSKKHILSLKSKFPMAEKISQQAVSICLEGVDRIMNQENKNIFCATRPPGHHALNTGKHEGFCFYNHIAITAKYIQQKYKLSKILIVDWDYHHGNSTEFFFYNDPTILFFSTHDQFAYPGTGSPDRVGTGKGKGFNINIHLPCNTSNKEIIDVFRDVLVPKANEFKPEFILISSGFDSRINDLLGCYKVTDEGFTELTRIVKKLANIHCKDRLLSVLEGGYNLEGNAKATIAHVKELNNFI